MPVSDPDLAKLLLAGQFLSEDQIRKAQVYAAEKSIAFSEALEELDLISDENLGLLVADSLKFPLVVLSKVHIPREILEIVPEVVAGRQKVLAFAKDQDGLKLAMVDPENSEIREFIAKKTGDRVLAYLATQKDFARAMALYKKDLQKTFDELLKDKVDQAGKAEGSDVPITELVNLLIEYAYHNRASDIHIEPEEKVSLVRFRIDGVLHDVLRLPRNLHEQLMSRIKVVAKLRTDEHLSAQDGKMQATLPEETLDIRVSVVPTIKGEKAVMRLLSSRARQFTLTDLGMTEADLEKVKSGFQKSYGMVLSTGPTGSGKTTTIYAILKILNTRERNIATIEDPVEYDIEGINQIQVNPKTNLTFADGLRAILRQDPNIIFVGEIRDGETAGIAVNSAMTGHLVLSTLHTNDAATSLPRLVDMDIEPFLIASTVNVIVAQRLVRKICENCRVSQTVAAGELAKRLPAGLLEKHFGAKDEFRLYVGKGCPVCHNTGYRGRIGIFEVLVMDDHLKEAVCAKADANSLRSEALKSGMTTMLEDGLQKAVRGLTTIDEVIRATKE